MKPQLSLLLDTKTSSSSTTTTTTERIAQLDSNIDPTSSLFSALQWCVEKSGLSVEQLREQLAAFQESSPSGQMSYADFRKFAQFLEDEEMAMKLFHVMDVNGNGEIDFIEYIIFISVLMQSKPDEKLKFIFKLIDENHDNKVTREELLKMVNILERWEIIFREPRELVDELMEICDTDKDDVLTEAEFVTGEQQQQQPAASSAMKNEYWLDIFTLVLDRMDE